MSAVKLFCRVSICFALCAVVLTGCAGTGRNSKSGPEGNTAVKKDGTPLVEYDGGMITVEEVKFLLGKMPQKERAQYQTPSGIKQLVNTIAERSVLASVARDKGFDKEKDVRAMLEILDNNILSQEVFQKELQPLMDNPVITEEDMKKYYEDNKKQFDKSKVKAAHILVKDEAEAKEIYKQVKDSPEKFAEMAKEKSIDEGSAKNGGDLGWFDRGVMVPEFEDVAFSLKPGEVSEPFKTMFGWHIIRLEDKTETGMKSFEDSKQQIRGILMRTQGRKAVEAKIEEYKANKHLKILEENLAKISETAPAAVTPPADLTPPPPAGNAAPSAEKTPPPPPDIPDSKE